MAKHYYYLARFTQDTDGVWCPPASCAGLIDLVPPKLDSEKEVNFAFMACESPLDSSDALHFFGSGDIRELSVAKAERLAWESITGYAPQGVTLLDLLRDHLTFGSQANGADFTRPLTCGRDRQLEILLAGERVWSHKLASMNEPLAQRVMEAEFEALRDVYRHVKTGVYPEEIYRYCLGGLKLKYRLSGSAETHLPSGDILLPKLLPLRPNTTKTESFPNNGDLNTVGTQDNTWTKFSGSTTVTVTDGVLSGSGSGAVYFRMEYAFGGHDQDTTIQLAGGVGVSGQGGPISRKDGTATVTGYIVLAGTTTILLRKAIAGSVTLLGTDTAYTPAINDSITNSVVGSSISGLQNGVVRNSATDTAITSGLYTGFRLSSADLQLKQFSATDNITPPAPTLAVTGTADNGTYAYGNVATNEATSHQFTITNTGDGSDTLGTLTISGDGWSIDAADNPSGDALAASGTTTVTVIGNFTTAGEKSGILTIPSNDANSPYVINLTAVALASGPHLGTMGLLGVGK